MDNGGLTVLTFGSTLQLKSSGNTVYSVIGHISIAKMSGG